MPIYEFLCEACGLFEQQRSLKEASEPMVCPTCQAAAKRVYSPPGFLLTPRALRRRIENSADPKLVTRSQPGEPLPPKLQHQVGGRPWQLVHASEAVAANPKLQRL